MESPISTKAALVQALVTSAGYGVEIIERVSKQTGLQLHQGSVYPMLVSLEEEGYIRRKLMRTQGRALYYELTREGRKLAKEHKETILRVFGLAA